MDYRAVLIGHDLHFDVSRSLHESFNEQRIVTKG